MYCFHYLMANICACLFRPIRWLVRGKAFNERFPYIAICKVQDRSPGHERHSEPALERTFFGGQHIELELQLPCKYLPVESIDNRAGLARRVNERRKREVIPGNIKMNRDQPDDRLLGRGFAVYHLGLSLIATGCRTRIATRRVSDRDGTRLTSSAASSTSIERLRSSVALTEADFNSSNASIMRERKRHGVEDRYAVMLALPNAPLRR
jgi:hypothetical protein